MGKGIAMKGFRLSLLWCRRKGEKGTRRLRAEGEKEKGSVFCLGEGKKRKRVEKGNLGDTISVWHYM